MLRKIQLMILILGVGIAAHADPVEEGTAGSEALYSCKGAGVWSLKDNDGAFLAVDPKKASFEVRPSVQTSLVCGNAVRIPDAEIQIHPSILVRSSKKGSVPNFERLAEGGFKFWLSLADKSRACEVVCTKVK